MNFHPGYSKLFHDFSVTFNSSVPILPFLKNNRSANTHSKNCLDQISLSFISFCLQTVSAIEISTTKSQVKSSHVCAVSTVHSNGPHFNQQSLKPTGLAKDGQSSHLIKPSLYLMTANTTFEK